MRSGLIAAAFATTLLGTVALPAAERAGAGERSDVQLKPTDHSRLPGDLSRLWMVPQKSNSGRPAAPSDFVAAVKLEVDGDFAKALPMLSTPAVQQGTLGHYAEYYKGLAELRLGRAGRGAAHVPDAGVQEPGRLPRRGGRAARSRERRGARRPGGRARRFTNACRKAKTTAPDDVLMRLGRAANAAGNTEKAVEAFSRVVYEFPFSDLAAAASAELETPADRADRAGIEPLQAGARSRGATVRRETVRAGARRRSSRCARRPQGDDRELVNLRLAECDYFLKRPRNARDGVRPYIEKASRQGEALFFYAVATRELGDSRRISPGRPPPGRRVLRRRRWAEEALNNLATHYILQNDDEQADQTFREMYEKFPLGRYAERAAWKIGWWAYKNGNYADAVRVFESAAAQFPRSDYRPSWLYWSARAHEALKEPALADARYTLVATDYLNTYYGRLAVKQLEGRAPQRRLDRRRPAHRERTARRRANPRRSCSCRRTSRSCARCSRSSSTTRRSTSCATRRRTWGDSPAIQATIGWIHNQRGDLRAGINAMKRAYPQYMAAGGEKLPPEMLKVLFPVDYWPLIQPLFGRARARSVHGGGAHRAGIDVYRRRAIRRRTRTA